ncbi:universal stress protein [Natrononativus amylolyticus]|uniref:universal stress protein n=1 Tax=Natrononativus amylolyticus TaxID=2963434 RepID=UPI0020CC5DEE|nr:universal stress protein [Natrononativus amylolyticus]
MYQDILVPTDGSDGSRRAIAHALELAEAADGTVHALAVLDEGARESLASDVVREGAERAARRATDRVETEADRRGVAVVKVLRRGTPAASILEYADETAVDAIVMGTHGRSGLDRLIVGSVTERVVQAADVPVVTVRMDDEITITEATHAKDIALEALADDHENPRVLEHPYRTSASWIVPIESDTGTGNVHVDAVTGVARVGAVTND